MTIYSKKRTPSKVYRKIYEQHYGPIPTDVDGRTYDIHHIDGNTENNDPSNLIAVSVQEHYNVHYEQEDYGACWLIARNMKMSPEEISELASKRNQSRVDNGTHNFLGGKYIKQLIEAGTHPFLGGELQRTNNAERVLNGTHNFLGDGEYQRSIQRNRFAAGTHNFQLALQNGTHNSQIKKTCPHCGRAIAITGFRRWHGDNCKSRPA